MQYCLLNFQLSSIFVFWDGTERLDCQKKTCIIVNNLCLYWVSTDTNGKDWTSSPIIEEIMNKSQSFHSDLSLFLIGLSRLVWNDLHILFGLLTKLMKIVKKASKSTWGSCARKELQFDCLEADICGCFVILLLADQTRYRAGRGHLP